MSLLDSYLAFTTYFLNTLNNNDKLIREVLNCSSLTCEKIEAQRGLSQWPKITQLEIEELS